MRPKSIKEQVLAIINSKTGMENADGMIYMDEAYEQATEKGNQIKSIKNLKK